MTFELYRSFEVHESIMDLDEETVNKNILLLAQGLVEISISHGIVWPNGEIPSYKDNFSFATQYDDYFKNSSWNYCISRTIKTPRSYKFLERAIAESWTRLQGEVSLRELIALETIRAICPGEYSTLLSIIEELLQCRNGSIASPDFRKKEYEEREKLALKSLASIRFSTHFGSTPTEITGLINNLTTGVFNGDSPDQSVAKQSGWEKYWNRLVSRSVEFEPITDQITLRLLKNFMNTGESREIVCKMIEISNFLNVFEHFSSWLAKDWEKLSLLYSQIVEAEVDNVKTTKKFVRPKAFFPLWRLWLKDNPFTRRDTDLPDPNYRGFYNCPKFIQNLKNNGDVLAWVSGRIFTSIQVSIPFLNEVYYYHSGNPNGTAFLSSPQVTQLRSEIHKYIREHGTDYNWWLERLQPGQPYALYHLFYHVAGKDQKPTLHEASDWNWSTPALIEACNANTDVIAPMLLFLLSKSHDRHDTNEGHIRVFEFNLEKARDLCNNDDILLNKLLNTLTSIESTFKDLEVPDRIGCIEILRLIKEYQQKQNAIL